MYFEKTEPVSGQHLINTQWWASEPWRVRRALLINPSADVDRVKLEEFDASPTVESREWVLAPSGLFHLSDATQPWVARMRALSLEWYDALDDRSQQRFCADRDRAFPRSEPALPAGEFSDLLGPSAIRRQTGGHSYVHLNPVVVSLLRLIRRHGRDALDS